MAKNKNDTSTAARITTASVLAFERKLDPSDGVFGAGRWEDKEARTDGLQFPFAKSPSGAPFQIV